MLEMQLGQQLSNVAGRIGRLWMWRRLTWAWLTLSIMLAGLAVAGRPIAPSISLIVIAGFVATVIWIRSRTVATPKTDVARHIEHAFPDLNSRLLAAIEQYPDVETGRMNILQRQVIAEAVHHSRMNDWADAVPPKQMMRAFLGQMAAFAIFLFIGGIAMQATSKPATARSTGANVAIPAKDHVPVTVEPGNAELERNSSLLVLARFTSKPPADVDVVWWGADQVEHRASLTKSLDDPIFATRLAAIKEDISYRVEFDGRKTEDYRITVYELPALVRSDLSLQFPSYTGLESKTVEDAFEATVVEGTQVTITCHVNQPLRSAQLFAGDNPRFTLSGDSENSTTYRTQFVPDKRMRLKLHLVDQSGRKNRDPEEFRIDVIPNRVPDLKLAFPGKDMKVSPLQEVPFEAGVIDDFGVLETALVVQVPGQDPISLPLGRDLKGGEQHKLSSIQRLEELRVQPDELVTYYLYADDFGPDGQRRRTSSDVFFAEVRSFDEIYRQVDQQGAGEMQSSQKPPDSTAKLLELQKQIIIATWKQLRLFNPKWSATTTEQIQTIHESQSQAIQKLQALRERMTQPQLQPIFSTIADAMEKAQQDLGQSVGSQSFTPLKPASAAEQSAYQGLLKLRAKEHLLMQTKAKGNGQQNEEKEKFDLEMKRKQDRYESEKAGAKKDESNVNREALAILDRLKELAQRQEGINQQLKELESQMRQATTEAEKEEIERRLKRLREEQQQLLHDSDEVRNKLNKSQQPETVAEIKNQLEQTRQRMVDTAEKLREGQLSQALNAGTRAERELKQIHEDFRKQTAAQFADAMRTLRDEARQLAEREQQLAEQLTQLGDESRRTLRQSQERAQLQDEFRQQREQTNQIVDKAKQVVEQAEGSEPLLAKQLYDTVRSTRESKLDQAQNATQQLLRQGILSEAAKAEQQARAAIDQLARGIEKAAESVLGNEVDSLKRARRELAELSQQLDREIQAQNPDGKSGKSARDPGKDAANQGQGKKDADGSGADQQPNGANSQQDSKPSDKPGEGKGSGSKGESGSPGDPSQLPGQDAKNGKGLGQSQGQGQGQGQNQGQGQGQGEGQGQGQGNGSPTENSDSPGASAGKSSDASAPTAPNASDSGQPSDRQSRPGLRSQKPGGRSSPSPGRKESGGENSNSSGSPGNEQGGGPLTGGDFAEFNERLRDVESMISDPRLQAEVQKVRDRARSARAEFKRHTLTPNWDLVRTTVHQPMIELQQRLAEEIAKRETPDSLVPVDRDPVPTRYRDLVRSYYERLGSGKEE